MIIKTGIVREKGRIKESKPIAVRSGNVRANRIKNFISLHAMVALRVNTEGNDYRLCWWIIERGVPINVYFRLVTKKFLEF